MGVIDLGSSSIKCMAGRVNEPDQLHLIAQLPTPTLQTASQSELVSEFNVELLDAVILQALDALANFIAGDQPPAGSGGNERKRRQKKTLDAIALTGQVGGVLCLDEHDRLISPSLTWADRRAADEAQTFWHTFGDRFKTLLGHDLPAQTCWSAPKIRRLMKLADESIYGTSSTTANKAATTLAPQSRVSCVMQLADYAFFRLTGKKFSSPTTGISLVDQTTGRYQPAVLKWAGLREDQLPVLTGGFTSRSPLSQKLAERWGRLTDNRSADLAESATSPVIVHAGADMYCGLFGSMAQAGQAIIQAGTTEIAGVMVHKNHQPPRPGVLIRLTFPPAPAQFGTMPATALSTSSTSSASDITQALDVIYGSTSNGGMSLSWLAREHSLDVQDPALWAAASKLIPDSDGLIFVPHVQGARSPLWCDQATGGFVGAAASCDPPQLLFAVLQGCAMSKRSVLQAAGACAMTDDHAEQVALSPQTTGAPSSASAPQTSSVAQASHVIVAGGGARQALANQIRADVLGLPVVARHVSDVTAAGAIALAMDTCCQSANQPISDTTGDITLPAVMTPGLHWLSQLHTSAGSDHYEPNLAHHSTYQRLYQRYLKAEQSMLPKSQQRDESH